MSVMESLLSRRNMLVGLTAGAATVGTVAVRSGQAQIESFRQLLWQRRPGRHRVPLGTAGLDDWALQIGSKFQTASGDVLKLADVRAFPQADKRPRGLRDRAFVAGFEVVSGNPLPDQLIQHVDHPEGGRFDILLSAGSPDKPGRMIAVFG